MENNNQNEDNEVFEEDEQLSDNNNNIEKESELEDKFLYSYFIKNFVYVSKKYPICNKSNITIRSLKNILNITFITTGTFIRYTYKIFDKIRRPIFIFSFNFFLYILAIIT